MTKSKILLTPSQDSVPVVKGNPRARTFDNPPAKQVDYPEKSQADDRCKPGDACHGFAMILRAKPAATNTRGSDLTTRTHKMRIGKVSQKSAVQVLKSILKVV